MKLSLILRLYDRFVFLRFGLLFNSDCSSGRFALFSSHLRWFGFVSDHGYVEQLLFVK